MDFSIRPCARQMYLLRSIFLTFVSIFLLYSTGCGTLNTKSTSSDNTNNTEQNPPAGVITLSKTNTSQGSEKSFHWDLRQREVSTKDPETQRNTPLSWVNPELAESLQEILNTNYGENSHFGASVAVLFGNPKSVPGNHDVIMDGATVLWQGVSGTANAVTGQKMSSDMYFDFGSVTKNFTSALTLKFVDNGILDLNERLNHYLKGIAANPRIGSFITLEELLDMEGGIGDITLELTYNPTGALDKCQWTPISTLSQIQPKQTWEPLIWIMISDWSIAQLKDSVPSLDAEWDKLKAIKGKKFTSSEKFWIAVTALLTKDALEYGDVIWQFSEQKYPARYSNANYLLAGIILANVINDQEGVPQLFNEVLFKNHYLNQLYFATGNQPPRQPRPIAFSGTNPKPPCVIISEYTQAFTTGAINGTASNLAYWFDSLFRKKNVVSQSMINKMQRKRIVRYVLDSSQCLYYSLGTQAVKVPSEDQPFQPVFPCDSEPEGKEFIYGHIGSINGFVAMGFYYPEKQASIVLLQNNNSSDAATISYDTFRSILLTLDSNLN